MVFVKTWMYRFNYHYHRRKNYYQKQLSAFLFNQNTIFKYHCKIPFFLSDKKKYKQCTPHNLPLISWFLISWQITGLVTGSKSFYRENCQTNRNRMISFRQKQSRCVPPELPSSVITNPLLVVFFEALAYIGYL